MPIGATRTDRGAAIDDGVNSIQHSPASAQAARAARESHGRLLALLASRSGDLAAAQDALADAFRLALEQWPERGVPDNPEGWLLTVARHRQLDGWRSAASKTSVPLDEEVIQDMFTADIDRDAIPDERMKLLFVCAHPAIDEALRAPLMMQTVMGLDAKTIGRAFLLPEATMAQRLVRVKRKIKDAVIPFALPSRSDMPERLDAVMEAIYGAFAIGWDLAGEAAAQHADGDLADEAQFLADLLVHLLPEDAEVLGLAACISLAGARRAARIALDDRYVPLESQDVSRWDRTMADRGERLLKRARAQGRLGRFQLEAAIQSVHNARAHTGHTDWPALALLYEGLMRIAPSIGAAVGRATAIGHAQGPHAGLAALDLIEPAVRHAFQPAWATRAHLLTLAGRRPEAVEALDRAIALARGPRLLADLARRRDTLLPGSGAA
jgi:predicted RNA polymerase sigma factor